MPEVRVDPLTGLKALVAEQGGPPLAADAPDPAPFARPDLHAVTAARGAQEVLLEDGTVADLDPGAWRAPMRRHAEAAMVHVHATVDVAGGVRVELLALPFVPAAVARERERFGAYATRTMGGNLLGDLVQEEVRLRERVVAIDDEAVLLAPFASATPHALLLAPRVPRARFEDEGPTGAALLRDALRRLAAVLGAPPALDLWVRTAPRGAERFCWRIDVAPASGAGDGPFQGTGVPRNLVAPEAAAAALRAV